MRHHAGLFVFILEMGFLNVGQAGLELPTSGDPPTLASQSPGITDPYEMMSCYDAQAGLKHLASSHPPILASQSAGITGVPHVHISLHIRWYVLGRAWWLTPVILALWEAKAGRSQGQEFETCLVNMASFNRTYSSRARASLCSFTWYSSFWVRRASCATESPGDPQAEQPDGSPVRLFRPVPQRGGSPHKIHWSVRPFNWRVELREGGLKRGLNQGASPGDSQAKKGYESQRHCFSLRSVSPQGKSHRSRRLFNRRLEHLGVDHSTKKRL
ncbi:hypothetical protein AAY473_036639 [Plecturocebus cupreus]